MPTVIDCTDKLVMPGLVDGHNHLCNTLMNISRAFPFDYSHISDHMLTTIHDPYGWLTPESLYDITMTSAINALKHGTTTVENSTILPDTAYEPWIPAAYAAFWLLRWLPPSVWIQIPKTGSRRWKRRSPALNITTIQNAACRWPYIFMTCGTVWKS